MSDMGVMGEWMIQKLIDMYLMRNSAEDVEGLTRNLFLYNRAMDSQKGQKDTKRILGP